MDINTLIFSQERVSLSADESKIPWDEPAFSQRMLENHLSQDHDWASRRLTVIEQQVDWITRQLPTGARILDLGCGPGFYTRLLAENGFTCTSISRRVGSTSRKSIGSAAGTAEPTSHRLSHHSSTGAGRKLSPQSKDFCWYN